MPALRVLVGVTGGIAAYKVVTLVRECVRAGHEVTVVPTDAALRFVGRPTWEAISRRPVETELFDDVAAVRHVVLGKQADVVIVAPATADVLARLAHGMADDLLATTLLASRAPLVLAPAMHTEMWEHPATQANVATLVARGAVLVGPASGALTGEDVGVGRMAEPAEILNAALGVAGVATGGPLAGRRIVVTVGGTREPIDPVRFVGNRSSGKQGLALAQAARRRGATVVLIAAHCEVLVPASEPEGGLRVMRVGTAAELRDAVNAEASEADAVIMAAAVADYRPAVVSDVKLKKDDSDEGMTLALDRTPDILAELGAARRGAGEGAKPSVLVGFAAETEPDGTALLRLARDKQAAKGADVLVVNRIGWDEGFGADTNAVTILGPGGTVVAEATGSKESVAATVLDVMVSATCRWVS